MSLVLAAAAGLLCVAAGLLARLLLRRPEAAPPPGRSREDMAREAGEHLARAIEPFERKADAARLARYRERYGDPPRGMPLWTPEEAVGILRASRLS